MKATVDAMNTARLEASRSRGEWLQSLVDDLVTLPDLLRAAASDRHLARLPLRTAIQAALAQHGGTGEAASRRVMDRLAVLLEIPSSQWTRRKQIRVGWLFDRRSGRRRLDALTEAVCAEQSGHTTPWPGFPLTPVSSTSATPAAREEVHHATAELD